MLREAIKSEIVPSSPKKSQIIQMFNGISQKYDFLNHFLSLGIDRYWRRMAVSMLKPYEPRLILDVATGTGDLAITALRLKPEKIIGIDISDGMLTIGKKKIKKKNFDLVIELMTGDSENLKFPENEFDAAMVAFGVRNFENLQKGLNEIRRVLKPGSPLVVLEFSRPRKFPVKQIYHFYFKNILPLIGRIFSKHRAAYSYLPQSVLKFPEGKYFLGELRSAGFQSTKERRLTFGIASLYIAVK
jgi:demethylmenaquinone methyltransferase / 2-methoxy-6-polyprenyl-1,4-benzoquinol methylase